MKERVIEYEAPPQARRLPVLSGERRLPWRRWLVQYLMIAPLTILLLAVTIYPLIRAAYMSVVEWDATSLDHPFIGLANYQELLTQDPRFISDLAKTGIIGGSALTIEFVVGFALALLFFGNFRGKRILTTLLLIPMMISPVVVGFTARMAFTTSYGFVTPLLGGILHRHLAIDWLGSTALAPVVIILIDAWEWTPFVFLLLFAGLQALSSESFEAALVDGATWRQTFVHIILPQMRYVILVAVLIRSLDLIKLFDPIMLATRAGPGIATEMISVFIYNVAFQDFRFGYAAAASFVLLIVIMVIIMFFVRTLGRNVVG
jgi:multiple sugar transport system permease protein